MRYALIVCTAVILAACSSSPATAPPAPSGSAPASMAIQAGDGQQALPGTPVPVDPAVIVKDGAGAPVEGASVDFAVDSGGGSVTGAAVTTGSNGVATVGGWTLGPTEGRNVLRATVGTLAPVRIAATATAAATVTYPAASIPAGGGSVTISDAGPLNGFKLSLPGGAFPTATEWTVSYGSNTALPKLTGVNPITPLITIASTTGEYAGSYMTLTVPVTVPAGMVPLVVLRDPASGTMEVLLTQQVSSGIVTATTAHLNGAHLIDTATTGSIRRASLQGGYYIQVFVTVLSPAQLAASYDTGYRPGTDDWDFESVGTRQEPEGICAGISITSMWYYFAHRKTNGTLFGAYDRAPGVWGSAVTGIHWASLVQTRVEEGDFKALNDYLRTFAEAGERDVAMYNALKANMMITRQPQLIVLAAATNGQIDAHIAGHAAIAWRTVGATIYIDDASFPGNQTTNVTFDGSRFSPFATPSHLGEAPVTYNDIATIGLSQELALDGLAADWASVVDKTINQAAFPDYPMRSKYGPVGDTLWLADTLRLWSECPTCTPVLTSPDFPEATASLVALHAHVLLGNGMWTTAADPTTYMLGAGEDVQAAHASTTGKFYGIGFELDGSNGSLTDTPGGPVTGTNFMWLDWHSIAVIKLGVSILPAPPQPVLAVPFTFKASIITGTRPGHITYQWDFGDGTAKVTATDDSTATHPYTTVGTYPVTVVLLNPTTQQPMVTATASALVTDPDYAWQLTSVGQYVFTPPAGGVGNDSVDMDNLRKYNEAIAAMQSNPEKTFFYLHKVGSCKTLYLEQFVTVPTPVVFDLSHSFGLYGSNCPVPPPYNASLTIGTLGNGALTGFTTEPPGVQDLTGGRVDATMNGATLSGTFTWRGFFSGGDGLYSMQFTATQVLPPAPSGRVSPSPKPRRQ